jgi:TPR repeat protein
MKALRLLLLLVAAIAPSMPAQSVPSGGVDIPKGVNYKKASDEVNAKARELMAKALANKAESKAQLLSDTFTCGPMLWKVLKPIADKTLLDSKPATGVIQNPTPTPTEARGLITDAQRKSFWAVLLKRYPALSTATIRKADPREISYYWATIPFDIEEPFFAIDAGADTFIANFIMKDNKPALFWIDLVGDLHTLAAKQTEGTEAEIVKAISEDAENNDPAAMVRMGKAYLSGTGVTADTEKGRTLLDRAAQKGVLEAQMFLGMSYFSGKYLPRDRKKSAEYLLLAANQGDAMAEYYVGKMYSWGEGLENSDQKALEFLQRAAEQNYVAAEYDLGVMYGQGTGVPRDKKKSCDLFAKAAEQGFHAAMNNLGHCYQTGDGIEKDLSKAEAWYTSAANAGNLKAQNNLAIWYGSAGDWETSYFWLRIAEIGGVSGNVNAIENVKKHLTPEQLDAIESKIADWQATHSKMQKRR